jgi:hypothetical protein
MTEPYTAKSFCRVLHYEGGGGGQKYLNTALRNTRTIPYGRRFRKLAKCFKSILIFGIKIQVKMQRKFHRETQRKFLILLDELKFSMD